ncbi:ATP-dependent Clp protease proteolytic subunit [Corynebacterium pseudodiphtheriticum]|uniref:head maturation protease, ClpP-related n=1 Tax=Corynebacterium pseudodiphtheriticum TaxID=37637 RepID=UPI00234CF5D1|nr:head maturation protease, ClpP-related [Corynebacterium pseudodiphtheriticum]MDC7086721.1 ATP-dependent Clp protease proteolytic subunit [Corynebacterium pseudodiphtheriticum]
MAIDLFGEVGWEITAKDVRTQLDGAGDVDVFLNSPGGDVYEGLAIMNALRAHEGTVTIFIEGMAASIASVIAVGGADRVVARPHAELMLHHAWSGALGNADEMRKSAENLERISANLADIYADKSGMSPDAVLDLMSAETWFSASEALAAGFVDAVEDARSPVVARGREPAFAKAMARFRFSGRGAAPAPRVNNAVESPPREQEGGPMSFLQKIADAVGMSPEEVRDELSGFFNESVEVEAKVEIEYPDSVKVAPTDKAVIEPVGVFPEGVEPSVEAGDGVTAEVDANGIVTVVAGEDVKPGDSVDVVVTVGESSAAITVEIVAAADTDGDDSASTPPAPSDSVSLDRETYDVLKAAAHHGWQAKQEAEQRALVAEVDRWVSEGRISAALRSKAVAAMKRDAEIARDLYGSNPKGTIPRAEIGHGHDAKADAEENAVSMSDLDNLVAGRREGRNKR